MAQPQPSTSPISEIFSGGDQSTVKGVSEHYMPSRYGNVRCEVSDVKIDVKNIRQMEVEFTFKLLGDEEIVEKLYEDEYWKYLRTKYVLEDAETTEGLKTPAPVMALMLNRYLDVVGAELTIERAKETVVVHSGADLLILPQSHPPLTDLSEGERYAYYDKKAAVIYANFRVNEEYHLRLKLEANAASFEFAPLFPYSRVEIKSIDTNTSSEYEVEAGASIAQPTVSDTFPPWYEEHLNKMKSHDPRVRPPKFRPAIPERGTFPLFSFEEIAHGVVQTEEDLKRAMDKLFVEVSDGIILNNYETVRFGFVVAVPADKNTDIIVRTIQRPLPTRIYEQMQGLPNYRDVLVEYDIFNLSHEKLRLRVETEIPGYTDKVAKTIFVPPLNNKKNQTARQVLHQIPRLQRNILETITRPARATMNCKVTNENTKAVLYDETHPIELLPHDQMVWELRDVRSNHAYKLYDFICAWVNPTDPDGLLDMVRTAAAEHHEDRAFGHKTTELEDIKKQVQAVYDYLTSYGMKYVSQPFTAKNVQASQRVVLPESVLKNKAGNCIDLSVLFASILEGVGIYSLVLITKDHAFIGWGDKRNLEKMFFLETTMLGYAPFDAAVEKGMENFRESFMFKGDNVPPMPADMVAHILGNHIVDLQKVRHAGLVSSRR